jgi:hypothetical protein
MSLRMMFSTRMRADSSLSCCSATSGVISVVRSDRADLEKLCHCPPLLLCQSCVLCLDHAQPGDRQLELHLELRLGHVRSWPFYSFSALTTRVDGGGISEDILAHNMCGSRLWWGVLTFGLGVEADEVGHPWWLELRQSRVASDVRVSQRVLATSRKHQQTASFPPHKINYTLLILPRENSTMETQLRYELKEWERTFCVDNGGRKPSKQDIKANASIGTSPCLHTILVFGQWA